MRKCILTGMSLLAGFVGGVVVTRNILKNKDNHRFEKYYNLICEWLALKQRGYNLKEYFEKNNYLSIAIYGMGGLGYLLYDELRNSNIKVKYGIDRESYCTYKDLTIIQPEEISVKVDVIVVTPYLAFNEIKEMLSSKTESTIISLEEVVFGVQET